MIDEQGNLLNFINNGKNALKVPEALESQIHKSTTNIDIWKDLKRNN